MAEWRCSTIILDFDSIWRLVARFTRRPLYSGVGIVRTHWLGGWREAEPVWTLWSREKSLATTGNQTVAVQLLAYPYID
jgi:hypothetical protein